MAATRIPVIDSHTGGEPTRVVLSGGPQLGSGPLDRRLEIFREHFDRFRTAIVCEPRGLPAMVGALLCEPVNPACTAGVIFFNNAGYLGMCGHGAIGLVATLAHLGRIGAGQHRLETPVGEVSAELHASGDVTIGNVASYRLKKEVKVKVEGLGEISGDIAWGGNWFFLVAGAPCEISIANLQPLGDHAWKIRRALRAQGITGPGGEELDHVELFGPPLSGGDSRNYVLCPGGEYDRSPCGTGTSAKLACLAADGKLQPGGLWRQESVTGSMFTGRYERRGDEILPFITGRAFVTGESELLLDESDPLCWGLGGSATPR
jgi:4-hydroxyproline epimerase